MVWINSRWGTKTIQTWKTKPKSDFKTYFQVFDINVVRKKKTKKKVLDILTSQAVTMNNHMWCVTPEVFNSEKYISESNLSLDLSDIFSDKKKKI